MTESEYVYRRRFLLTVCKQPEHFCSGKKIGVHDKEKDFDRCKHLKDNTCNHPMHPKVRGAYVD